MVTRRETLKFLFAGLCLPFAGLWGWLWGWLCPGQKVRMTMGATCIEPNRLVCLDMDLTDDVYFAFYSQCLKDRKDALITNPGTFEWYSYAYV